MVGSLAVELQCPHLQAPEVHSLWWRRVYHRGARGRSRNALQMYCRVGNLAGYVSLGSRMLATLIPRPRLAGQLGSIEQQGAQ